VAYGVDVSNLRQDPLVVAAPLSPLRPGRVADPPLATRRRARPRDAAGHPRPARLV